MTLEMPKHVGGRWHDAGSCGLFPSKVRLLVYSLTC